MVSRHRRVKHRVQKGNMCMNLILKSEVGKIRDLAMPKYLFMTKLLPVMYYGCELWGFRVSEELCCRVLYWRRIWD